MGENGGDVVGKVGAVGKGLVVFMHKGEDFAAVGEAYKREYSRLG